MAIPPTSDKPPIPSHNDLPLEHHYINGAAGLLSFGEGDAEGWVSRAEGLEVVPADEEGNQDSQEKPLCLPRSATP